MARKEARNEAIIALRKEGYSLNEIAKAAGISHVRVCHILKQYLEEYNSRVGGDIEQLRGMMRLKLEEQERRLHRQLHALESPQAIQNAESLLQKNWKRQAELDGLDRAQAPATSTTTIDQKILITVQDPGEVEGFLKAVSPVAPLPLPLPSEPLEIPEAD